MQQGWLHVEENCDGEKIFNHFKYSHYFFSWCCGSVILRSFGTSVKHNCFTFLLDLLHKNLADILGLT